MSFVDFAAIKQAVPIEKGAQLLGLELTQHKDQLRGPCPACGSGGKRALVITPAKRAFYCFAGHTGGDVISLVAHIRGNGMKEAASFLDEGQGRGTSVSSSPEERVRGGERAQGAISPLTYLQPEHHLVQEAGLLPETCAAFGAGYAPKGIMRGRLAIPIHDSGSGGLVAYAGYCLKGEGPDWLFPKGFDPEAHIFHHPASALERPWLMSDPVEVLHAYQNGIEDGIAFLTEQATPEQFEMLARFMRGQEIERL